MIVALANALGGLDGVMLYQIALCVGVAAAWYGMQRLWGRRALSSTYG